MTSAVCRQGDCDSTYHQLTQGLSQQVTVNGLPVGLKDSQMNDGTPVEYGCSLAVTIQGRPVVVLGSSTVPHYDDSGVGTMIQASATVRVG